MKYLTPFIATFSTITPEIAQASFIPVAVTEGTSLLVQLVTALIAVISFFKGLKRK